MAGNSNSVLLLRHRDVSRLLTEARGEVVEAVRRAYIAHEERRTVVPPSVFLRSPARNDSRFIALPAYLDTGDRIAGIKWIASFPDNVQRGDARASAVIILNSCDNGYPEVIMEGAAVSAHRTGAGAALVAAALVEDEDELQVGVIGCGRINAEVVRYLRALVPARLRVVAHDVNPGRAARFCVDLGALPRVVAIPADGLAAALADANVLAIATTAASPHISSLETLARSAVVLHVSLRDLTADVIRSCDNIVDDIEHVARERTSIALALAETGGEPTFVNGTIGRLLTAGTDARAGDRPVIVSPFGLGVLDLAVARVAVRRAMARGLGIRMEGFRPDGLVTTSGQDSL